MRKGVLAKLRNVVPDVSSSDVFRVALWLLGQYWWEGRGEPGALCGGNAYSPSSDPHPVAVQRE